jgi:hypothetical protein
VRYLNPQNDQVIYVGLPTPIQLLEAESLYHEILVDSQYLEILTDSQMVDHLIEMGLWSLEEQSQIDELPKKLEAMKFEMYKLYVSFRSKRMEQIRRMIQRTIKENTELYLKRHSYHSCTCEGFALSAKLQYLVLITAVDGDGNWVNSIADDGNLLENIVHHYVNSRIDEHQIRKFARNEPWRSIWSASKSEGKVFDISPVSMSADQKTLVAWSRLYDGVRESIESPDDKVIEDDYLLDGWLIAQHKKREEERKAREGRKVGGDKMSDAGEIYIPAETYEDARRIDAMNDPQSAMVKRQRAELIKKHGGIAEQNMPDSQIQMRQQALQQIRDRMKSNKK